MALRASGQPFQLVRAVQEPILIAPRGGGGSRGRFGLFLRRAGLPRIRLHDLRHTAATLLLEAGTHPRVVAERLAHSTPSLVMNTYGPVTERMQEQATATLNRVLGA
jgi:integrase